LQKNGELALYTGTSAKDRNDEVAAVGVVMVMVMVMVVVVGVVMIKGGY
jgi:hypothetical protein